MAGTVAGGLKAAKTLRKLHGKDFYRKIGRIGGSARVPKGFAIDKRSWLERVILNQPSLAQLAGAKGGKISKRRKAYANRSKNS